MYMDLMIVLQLEKLHFIKIRYIFIDMIKRNGLNNGDLISFFLSVFTQNEDFTIFF